MCQRLPAQLPSCRHAPLHTSVTECCKDYVQCFRPRLVIDINAIFCAGGNSHQGGYHPGQDVSGARQEGLLG